MTTDLALRPDQHGFTPTQTDALRRQIGVDDVPDDELAVFFHLAMRTGLDPFARQVYLIPRWDGRKGQYRYVSQTSIDGLRLIADRTGRYAGSDAPQFGHDEQGRPWATVTVWKLVQGGRYGFSGVAYWDEFVQLNKKAEPQGLWAKMPRTMLAKCAEAQALRKAFPAEMSGLYTHEEMSQADSEASQRGTGRGP